ncbi:MAG: hypothetical protein K2L82_09390 [Lachnospiraceae bacterium]|nr:hypothetical protein [Lachnospiraceae bacterium]
MRLYRVELYKLCHKKFFVIGIVCILSVLTLLFCQRVGAAKSTINGIEYHGYEAVMADRQITKEFTGLLSDDMIQQIVMKYGFPQKVEKYDGFSDSNFLNNFVATYASDGYLNDWEDYRIATKSIPLAETHLGELSGMSGNEIWFAYYGEWNSYPEWYYLGMIMISILLLCVVSTTFSVEEQSNTKPLLFTTQEGPAKDTYVKIAAAFTLAIGLWLAVTVFSLLLYSIVYGTDSFHCLANLVISFSEPLISFKMWLAQSLFLSLLGILELCTITLCISAYCHSTFHSVAVCAFCWAIPLLSSMVLRGIIQILLASSLEQSVLSMCSLILFPFQLMLLATPFYLINFDIVSELDNISFYQGINAFCIIILFAAAVALLCIMGAYRKYRKR